LPEIDFALYLSVSIFTSFNEIYDTVIILCHKALSQEYCHSFVENSRPYYQL